MSPETIGIIAMAGLIALILLRIPVAVALGLVGFFGYAAVDNFRNAFSDLANTPYEDMLGKYGLTVVPLFILMGVVTARSGMSRELYQAANAIFSGVRGALAMGTIGACAGFGAICGSSLATSATMARVAVPEMRRYGYDERLATGAVASGGTLGILIPPSVILVIYAIVAERGVPELFAAAMFPGLALAALHIVVIAIIALFQPERMPRAPTMSIVERLGAMVGLWKVVILFGIAVGGIYSGFMSPTEAAAVSAFVAIVIAFATRSLTLSGFREAVLETIWTTAVLFFIAVCAFHFAHFMVLTQMPQNLSDWVEGLGLAPLAVLLILIAFYIVLGCFLDSISMILITVPVFLPLIVSLNYDPVWYGILVVIVVEVGLITPPVGMNIFVIRAQLPEVSLGTVYRGVIPFLAADAAIIAILTMLGATLTLPGIAVLVQDILEAFQQPEFGPHGIGPLGRDLCPQAQPVPGPDGADHAHLPDLHPRLGREIGEQIPIQPGPYREGVSATGDQAAEQAVGRRRLVEMGRPWIEPLGEFLDRDRVEIEGPALPTVADRDVFPVACHAARARATIWACCFL